MGSPQAEMSSRSPRDRESPRAILVPAIAVAALAASVTLNPWFVAAGNSCLKSPHYAVASDGDGGACCSISAQAASAISTRKSHST
jgi:hypothetical protein